MRSKILGSCCPSLLVLAFALQKNLAFHLLPTVRCLRRNCIQTYPSSVISFYPTKVTLIPELGSLDLAVDVSIAIVSTLAGAAMQLPRLAELEAERNELRRKVEQAQTELTDSESKLLGRISQLEDSLFEMDREFEGQSSRMKKKYDTSLREELQALTVRLKKEFDAERLKMDEAYKSGLELQLEVERNVLRQGYLKEKLELISDSGDKTRNQLARILEEQAKISSVNVELEKALELSKQEIEYLVQQKGKGSWWPFRK